VILKSQKGSATILFALSLPVFICALAMAWDIGMLYTAKITARHSVILAARAAASELNLELVDLTNPGDVKPTIKEDEALNAFKGSLDKNLKHHKGRLFAINESDDIEQYISGFVVANGPGRFQVGSRTVQISQPAVAAEIEVPVELSTFGALVMGNKNDNEVTVRAFTVAAPEIREEFDS
jgi:uncharacterized membrane protein